MMGMQMLAIEVSDRSLPHMNTSHTIGSVSESVLYPCFS